MPHLGIMPIEVLDENDLKKLPAEQRLQRCTEIIKQDDDESKRWDAVWIAGELANKDKYSSTIYRNAAELMMWVLKNDSNGVVKHEACYQIAARNIREAIPVLIDSALNDPSDLTKHESLESLGLMRAFESKALIKNALKDPSKDVRETASFVLKRLDRMEGQGEYIPSEEL